MQCPICNDSLPVSADRCTFCGYDFRTGKRGAIEPPEAGAAAAARKQGIVLVAVGIPAVLGALLLLALPSIITRVVSLFVALPAAGGVVARGMNRIGQARRWDLKQRLYDETHAQLAAAAADESPVAVPPLAR